MKFTVAIPEKVSLNRIYAGVHWRKRAEWKEEYWYAVMEAKIATYSGSFPVHAHYHFILHGKVLDSGNVAFMAKCVEDSLVACGVLPDDGPKYVASMLLTTEKAKKGEADRVEVELSTMYRG